MGRGGLCLVGVLCACTGPEMVRDVQLVTSSTKEHPSCKAEAPVTLVAEAQVVAGRRYIVALTATAGDTLDWLELRLLPGAGLVVDGDVRRYPTTYSGERRRAEYLVELTEPGADLYASARVSAGGIEPSRLLKLRLGTPSRVAPPETQITMASGEVVEVIP